MAPVTADTASCDALPALSAPSDAGPGGTVAKVASFPPVPPDLFRGPPSRELNNDEAC